MRPEIYKEMAQVQDRHWWFVARRRILDRVITALKLPGDAQILEIGCGPGGNLAMLQGHGQLQALETDPQARELAADLGICPVEAGALPEPLPFPSAAFDLVCLFDVLEHIGNDREALQAVAGLLKPGGRILITVPAYAWLWSAHDEAHHHQRRYTAPGLERVARAAGLVPRRLGYFNTLLFPLIAAIRSLQRLTGKSADSDAALPSPGLNRLLTAIFGFERHLLPLGTFPFGTSVLAVLENPPCSPRP